MPVIKMYRTIATKEEASGDELVTVKELERWLENKDRVKHFDPYDDGRNFGTVDDVYEWSPDYPAGYVMYSTTIPDEALMSSNYDAILEQFEDAGLADVIVGSESAGTFDIAGDEKLTMNALALACKLDEMAENYPVLDEELMSEREMEYIQRDFESYGRNDAIAALADNGSEIVDEFDELLEGYEEIAGPHLFRLAMNVVSCSGELYFSGYALQSVLDEMVSPYGEWPRPALGELIDRFDAMVRREKIEADRVEFEKYQSPIAGMEV